MFADRARSEFSVKGTRAKHSLSPGSTLVQHMDHEMPCKLTKNHRSWIVADPDRTRVFESCPD